MRWRLARDLTGIREEIGRGLIPFSAIFASSIIQDGHGMLPLLSYTVRDSILIKLFNLAFGLTIGAASYLVAGIWAMSKRVKRESSYGRSRIV